jgi:hypothetical protein
MDAEGETLRLADAGETLRLQYHRGMHLWRAPVCETGHRRGKPLRSSREQSLRYQGQSKSRLACSVLLFLSIKVQNGADKSFYR